MVQCCVSLPKSFLTAASNIWKLDEAAAAFFFFLKLPELDGKIPSHRQAQIKVISVPLFLRLQLSSLQWPVWRGGTWLRAPWWCFLLRFWAVCPPLGWGQL